MSDTTFENMTLAEKLNAISTAMATPIMRLNDAIDRHYTVNHELDAIESLDALYNRIIATNSELTDVSAVGFTAILKNGDTIKVNGNHLYINNVVEQLADYTFTGTEGYEVVNLWFFGNPNINLPDEIDADTNLSPVTYEITLLDIRKKISGEITLGKDYYYDTEEIHTDGFFNFVKEYSIYNPTTNTSRAINFVNVREKPWTTKKMVINGFPDGIFKCKTPDWIESIESDCTEFSHDDVGRNNIFLNFARLGASFFTTTDNPQQIINRSTLTHAHFPKLKTITCKSISVGGGTVLPAFLRACENINLKITFPCLETITDSYDQNANPFSGIYSVILPKKVKSIGKGCFFTNNFVRLECNEAETIHTNFCANAPIYFELSPDWAATISLAVAATSWNLSDFTNLIGGQTNGVDNLRTMTTETVKQLTVPMAIFTQLNAANSCAIDGYMDKSWVEYADEVKHWTIIGA